jgi:Kdo2-lipid IVA lauroyltransferase/acyltransferase
VLDTRAAFRVSSIVSRFRLETTEELALPRDAEGRVDVKASMQMMTDIVEGWVREHPEQWLWLHRRWR